MEAEALIIARGTVSGSGRFCVSAMLREAASMVPRLAMPVPTITEVRGPSGRASARPASFTASSAAISAISVTWSKNEVFRCGKKRSRSKSWTWAAMRRLLPNS